jgi:4a-hydroxytetrahydrobiopterin dehydratase
MLERINPADFHRTEGLQDWRVTVDGANAFFRTGSFADAARLVHAISELTGIGARQPDIDVRHESVTVTLVTTEPGSFALTARDVELARHISAIARELGLTSDPSGIQTVQVTIDALSIPDILPFWRAVLGYIDRDNGGEDLMDPLGRGAPFYFQQMDKPRPQRNRVHVDVCVAYEHAEARVKAAIAAGGRLVNDADAPENWVLADPEGNEACVGAFGWLAPTDA